jgi:hypothetical protein
MKIKILFPLLFCSITATAQGVDCNQKVWPPRRNAPTLPKGICIPQGMFNYITYVRDRTDVNGDGLEDFICKWNAKPLHDGDVNENFPDLPNNPSMIVSVKAPVEACVHEVGHTVFGLKHPFEEFGNGRHPQGKDPHNIMDYEKDEGKTQLRAYQVKQIIK